MEFYLVREGSQVERFPPDNPEDRMPPDEDADNDNQGHRNRDNMWALRYRFDDYFYNPRRIDERDHGQDDNADADANMEGDEEHQQENRRMNGDGDREEDNERVDEMGDGSMKIITIGNLIADLELVEGSGPKERYVETVKRAVGTERLHQELSFKVKLDNRGEDEEGEMGSILVKNYSYADGLSSPSLRGPEKISILERLINVFGENNVSFELTIGLTKMPSEDAEIPDNKKLIILTAKDFKMVEASHKSVRISAEIEKLPSGIWDLWGEGQRLEGNNYLYSRVTLKVRLNENAVNIVRLMEAGADMNDRKLMDGNRRLLEQEICSDLEIVCRGGRVVKCHRAFLAGRSAVFRAMFEKRSGGGGEMKEARDGKLVLGDKWTEKCVRAMLKWVYTEQVGEGVEKDFELVLELLEAGHKWEVDGLAEEMTAVLMGRRKDDEGWWTVGRALKLYLFARYVEEMKGLRDRAAGILKRYGMNSGRKLVESAEYQGLFRNDPQTAMELTTLYLHIP